MRFIKVSSIILISVGLLLSTQTSEAMVTHKERLDSLEPRFRAKIERLIEYLERMYPHDEIVIASTFRSFAEQDALYAKGRHVTNARGGESAHNFGRAVDIFFIKDGKIRPVCPRYFNMGKYAKELGLVWGGDFRRPFDPAHIERKDKL